MSELMNRPAAAPGALGMVNWIAQMREAAQKCIKASDIEEMVNAQVAAAKKGDRNALRFVFEQVLGGGGVPRGLTLVQENHYPAGAGETPERPIVRDVTSARANASRTTRF